MAKEQTKLEKAVGKLTNSFNPYDKKHMGAFLAVVAITAGAAGYYGFRTEKKDEKKKK